jgi:hypothetical protein
MDNNQREESQVKVARDFGCFSTRCILLMVERENFV